MWPYLVAAAVGAALAGRRQPKTRYKRRECIGPRSGLVYRVEDFPEAGFIVVRTEDGAAQVTFDRHPDTGLLRYVRSLGHPEAIALVRQDLEGPADGGQYPADGGQYPADGRQGPAGGGRGPANNSSI
jgi:hypothetical protein